jgi:hypothetical protein
VSSKLLRQRTDNWLCVPMREKVRLLLKTLLFKQSPVKIIFVLQLCNLLARKEPRYISVGFCLLCLKRRLPLLLPRPHGGDLTALQPRQWWLSCLPPCFRWVTCSSSFSSTRFVAIESCEVHKSPLFEQIVGMKWSYWLVNRLAISHCVYDDCGWASCAN